MAKPKSKPAVYGTWKVTAAEYEKARTLSRGQGDVAECAYQLVRYCDGQVFCRDDAMKSLQAIRGWIPAAAVSA